MKKINKSYTGIVKSTITKKLLIELSAVLLYPKIRYTSAMTNAGRADEIEEKINVFYFTKRPKRADIYWFTSIFCQSLGEIQSKWEKY
jgi:KUP system potassium uptake protein